MGGGGERARGEGEGPWGAEPGCLFCPGTLSGDSGEAKILVPVHCLGATREPL